MKNIILTIFTLVFGGSIIYTSVLMSNLPLSASPTFYVVDTLKPSQVIVDTPKPPPIVLTSVRNKTALFIGDSHTAADYGWQYQLCK
jgi:hypothetical protein